MGSPVSPIVANFYMEKFEDVAITSAKTPPDIWLRYVDDTFVVLSTDTIEEFTTHINGMDTNIKFTREEAVENKLAFLDTWVVQDDNGNIKTLVYRKPTHTDQYLAFESNHHLAHKKSVVRSLVHRAHVVVSGEEDRKLEIERVYAVLRENGYKEWTFKPPRPKKQKKESTGAKKGGASYTLPYVQGVSEQLSKIFKNHDINTYFKPYNTIREQLVHPKDPVPPGKKCGVIYKIACNDCEEIYVGETSRALGTRLKEHLRTKGSITAVGEHIKASGHSISLDSCSILGREDKFWRRKVHESVAIHQQRPTLNRDTGFYLPPIYQPLIACDSARAGSHDRQATTTTTNSQ